MKKILKIFITIISLLFISYFGSAIAIGVSNNEAEFMAWLIMMDMVILILLAIKWKMKESMLVSMAM